MLRKILVAAAVSASIIAPASAQTTQRDLEVIGRAMSFLQGASGSDRVIAIAHAADGAAEAQAISDMMSGGLSTGRVTLTGRLVDAADSAGLAGAHAVILVGSALDDAGLRDAAAAQGVLTVSTLTDCASAGSCMLGVASAPSVRIVVNRANLDSAGIGFDPAFVLMVEEV